MSQSIKKLNLEIEHLLRRLTQAHRDVSPQSLTGEIMNAREKYLDERLKRQRAEKELGEALASLTTLRQMVDA